MRTSEVLEQALDLLGPQGENWTKGAFARTAEGKLIPTLHEEAARFCPSGALCRVLGEAKVNGEFYAALKHLHYYVGGDVSHWNDKERTSFCEVREIFKRAICAAQLIEARQDRMAA